MELNDALLILMHLQELVNQVHEALKHLGGNEQKERQTMWLPEIRVRFVLSWKSKEREKGIFQKS